MSTSSLAAACAAEAVDIAARLMAASSSNGRAKLLAGWAVDLMEDSACVVYRFDPELPDAAWKIIGRAGDVSVGSAALPAESPLFMPLLATPDDSIVYVAAEMQREDYAHLQVTRTLASIAYLPYLRASS